MGRRPRKPSAESMGGGLRAMSARLSTAASPRLGGRIATPSGVAVLKERHQNAFHQNALLRTAHASGGSRRHGRTLRGQVYI
jgi:hypothetical protein